MPLTRTLNLACDNGISQAAVRILEHRGYRVVLCAQDEPDSWWFTEAMTLGADVFISHDTDIICMADDHGKRRIEMPQRLRGRAQADFILEALRRG